MWSSKYTPQHIRHIIMDDGFKVKMTKLLCGDSIPNMIVSSSIGMGKSILIDCIAREFYENEYSTHVCKLNTSIEKNIKKLQDDMELFCKRQLNEKCVRKTKLFIVDDIDNISEKIQNVIAYVMTNNKNVNFLFSCCSSANIIDIIQSRSTIVRLQKPSNEKLMERLELICKKEHCPYTIEALERICFTSQNDVRVAINKLQVLSNKFDKIDIDGIDKICDTPSIIFLKEIIQLCLEKKINEAINKSLSLYSDGFNCVDILTGIFEIIKTSSLSDTIEFNKKKLTEKNKIDILSLTGKVIYKTSKKIDSKIQLEKFIVKFCEINL